MAFHPRHEEPLKHSRSIFTARAVFLLDAGSGKLDTSLAGDGDCPHWRGRAGNDVSSTRRPPVEWSASKNVLWKVELPDNGSASPVIGD